MISKQLTEHYTSIVKNSKMTKEESDALFERLMYQEEKAKEKLTNQRKETMMEEIKRNTHKPSINGNPYHSTSNFKSISERTDEIMKKREDKINEAKKKHFLNVEEEIEKECTFKPHINTKNK